jgi:hypothetical protein
MNSELCTFVSDLFYESRLSPTKAATKSHLGTAANPVASGVYFIPTLHSGCTQGSQEEAAETVKLVSQLVGKRAVVQGKERTLEHTIVTEADTVMRQGILLTELREQRLQSLESCKRTAY